MARIAALEAELEGLKREVAAEASAPAVEAAPVSRRRVLWSGGAAVAGAAGAMLASPSTAGAQAPPTASQVSFTPAGGVEATDVQAAITEVDAEKAALSGATFSGPVQAVEGRFVLFPTADVRAFGATGNGSTDDTAAIQTAINAVAGYTGGGTVLIPAGRYRFSSEIVVPNGVDLWGGGGHGQAPENQGTVLQAATASARLVIRGEGGQTGNFLVHGRKVASPAKGLVSIDATERAFTALRISHSLTDGLVIERSQNCTFTQLYVYHHDRDGLVLDVGAGGNGFFRSEFGGCGRDSVVIRETAGNGPYVSPQHNLFLHCLMERGLWQGGGWNGPNNSQLNISAGSKNKFSHCIFSLQPDVSTSGSLVLISGGVATFDDCNFTGSAVTGVFNNGAGAHFMGLNWFNCPTAIRWDGNAWGRVLGSFEYGGAVNTRWTGSGTWSNKSWDSRLPYLASLEPAAQFGLRTHVHGDDGYRFQVSRTGEIQVSDGTTYSPKARWRLQADGSGWETPDDLHLNGGSLAIQEVGTTPPDPPAGNRAVVYVKGDKLVVAFNDAGTMRYRSLALNGTGATWVHSTTAP